MTETRLEPDSISTARSAFGVTRQIHWTDTAIDDLRFWRISKGEWQVIRSELQRIAAVEKIDLDSAVCRVRQTGLVWLRLKIWKPRQLRVIFSIEQRGTRLVVQAVLRRSDNTYKIVEILFRRAMQS